jgi:hypothetical protein
MCGKMAPLVVHDIIMKECGAPTATHTNRFWMALTGSNPSAAVGAPGSFASKTPRHCRSSLAMMACAHLSQGDSFDLSLSARKPLMRSPNLRDFSTRMFQNPANQSKQDVSLACSREYLTINPVHSL